MSNRYIVSANYQDRESAYRWLIRKEGQPINQARACMSVSMQDVKFVDSSIEEAGFGCQMVASCGYAIGEAFEDEELEGNVRFVGAGFINVRKNKYIDELVSLELKANGTMQGVFVKEPTQESDQKQESLVDALNGTLVAV